MHYRLLEIVKSISLSLYHKYIHVTDICIHKNSVGFFAPDLKAKMKITAGPIVFSVNTPGFTLQIS